MTDERTPTSGSAWRKAREQGYTVELPSGNVATLRPVAVDGLIAQGKLPDLLSPIAARSLWTETEPATLAESPELAKGFAELVNAVVPAAMLVPRVVDEPTGEDEIHLDDLEFADKIAIFNLASGGATTLKRFCEQQATDVAALPDSEDLQPTTE